MVEQSHKGKAGTDQATTFATLVGDLYSRWTLDMLIDVAYAVSLDFINRPQFYDGTDIPDSIAELRVSYGTDVRFPNTAERHAMMAPILGRSDELKPDASWTESNFHVARKQFIDACIAFSERAVDTGVPMLEERVRTAIVPLQKHFEGLRGKALQLASKQLTEAHEGALGILRSSGVAKVFGVAAAETDWPFTSSDPNGAKLIEAVGALPDLSADLRLNYSRFISLQRVAQEGGRALELVLVFKPKANADLIALITQSYTWASALRDFQEGA